MTEPVQPPSATNGTTKVPPEIRMKILQVEDGWTLEVMCAVKEGTMQKKMMCSNYENVVKSVPSILTQIKEQFYAR